MHARFFSGESQGFLRVFSFSTCEVFRHDTRGFARSSRFCACSIAQRFHACWSLKLANFLAATDKSELGQKSWAVVKLNFACGKLISDSAISERQVLGNF